MYLYMYISVSAADSLPQSKKFLYRLKNKQPVLRKNAITWTEFVALGNGVKVQDVPYQKDQCCLIAHTGGTTGTPKGVMLSNDNMNAVMHGYRHLGVPFERKHRFFNDLPPFIVYGLCLAIHTTLCYGLEVIYYPVFDSKAFPKMFAKYLQQIHSCFEGLSVFLSALTEDHKVWIVWARILWAETHSYFVLNKKCICQILWCVNDCIVGVQE